MQKGEPIYTYPFNYSNHFIQFKLIFQHDLNLDYMNESTSQLMLIHTLKHKLQMKVSSSFLLLINNKVF
jgi:hypothetical protein